MAIWAPQKSEHKRGVSDEDAERIAAQLRIKLKKRRARLKVNPFLKFDAKAIS
jgi:hypothetical protein